MKALLAARRCPTVFVRLKANRQLSSAHTLHDDSHETASPAKPTVTKKKYSELPKCAVQSAIDLEESKHGADPTNTLSASKAATSKDTRRVSRKARADNTSARHVEPENAQDDLTSKKSTVRRGTRLKTTTNSSQEQVPLVAQEEEEEQPSTPLAVEILQNRTQFPYCILLTRVGQFYESYFDQAQEVAHLLGIKLTTRRWGKNGKRVPMCGFPLQHLDKYLKVLVQQHKRSVAMCEEFRRTMDVTIAKEFDRRVTRIITPGTLIDESFINLYDNNYLLAIHLHDQQRGGSTSGQCQSIGLAWIDVSTGEFFTKSVGYESLRDELARIGPSEVVLDHCLKSKHTDHVVQLLREDDHFVTYTRHDTSSLEFQYDGSDNHEKCYSSASAGKGSISLAPSSFSASERGAIDILTSYLRTNLREYMPTLAMPNREVMGQRMQIDAHTIKALELRESTREGSTKGSLLATIRRTITSSGARLLAQWLCSPSTCIEEINARQSLVAFFRDRPHFQADILYLLNQVEDMTRIVQKFMLGRGEVNDLSSVAATIHVWTTICERAREEKAMEEKEKGTAFELTEWTSLENLLSHMADFGELSSRIGLALSQHTTEEQARETESTSASVGPPNSIAASESRSFVDLKWTISPQFSQKLLKLHHSLNSLLRRRLQLESSMQLKYNAPSLTLRASPGLGMHVHLAKAKRDQRKVNEDSSFITIAESGTTKCYFNQEWTKLGNDIVSQTAVLALAEKEEFQQLRNEITARDFHLRRNARLLDELDVALGFSKLSQELGFVRPCLTDDSSYDVVNGRHPTVELGLLTSGKVFIPNTISLDSSSYLRIQTGPNMAGKSTLLRQAALIAILAQTGSFVPADSATVGIIDRLFSRIGANDDLFHDRSTFMVEMMETSDVLRRATSRSLVIMDEVGRGTTVKEGLAIAFAAVHHLVTVNKCRTLFATHFHEIADMLGYSAEDHRGAGPFKTVSFYCSDVDDTDDEHFSYSYQVKPGINRDSQGLRVARLAGMPETALSVAKNALSWLRQHDDSTTEKAHKFRSLGELLATSATHNATKP